MNVYGVATFSERQQPIQITISKHNHFNEGKI